MRGPPRVPVSRPAIKRAVARGRPPTLTLASVSSAGSSPSRSRPRRHRSPIGRRRPRPRAALVPASRGGSRPQGRGGSRSQPKISKTTPCKVALRSLAGAISRKTSCLVGQITCNMHHCAICKMPLVLPGTGLFGDRRRRSSTTIEVAPARHSERIASRVAEPRPFAGVGADTYQGECQYRPDAVIKRAPPSTSEITSPRAPVSGEPVSDRLRTPPTEWGQEPTPDGLTLSLQFLQHLVTFARAH